MTDVPYASLFKVQKRKKEAKIIENDTIPLKTLQDIKITKKNEVNDYVTIFGANLHKLKEIEQLKSGEVVEQGRNWIKVHFENEDMYKECIKLDKTMIEDEIIGCYRNIENVDDRKKGKNTIMKIKEYFFGV
ncbi:hypothetical protein BDAP_000714 [Binucleata daphniae]